MVQNGATKPEVYRVSTTGNPSRERVRVRRTRRQGPVTALALSPDGVRVAIVAGERLYLGVVDAGPGRRARSDADQHRPAAPHRTRRRTPVRAGPVG